MTIVPEGTVSLAQWVTWVDKDSRANLAHLVSPEITVDRDVEVTLDARTASQFTIDTPQPAEPLNDNFDAYIQRATPAGESYGDRVYFTSPVNSWGRLWARVEQTTLRAFGLSDPSAPRPTNAR